MPRKNEKPSRSEDANPRVNIYPAWCKKCGNCVEFCPVKALEQDEWGFPRLAKAGTCTACRLCEKLCPDFAITVGEPTEIKDRSATPRGAASASAESSVNRHHSPERVLPALEDREDGQEADRDEE